jgi:hypothetical protein
VKNLLSFCAECCGLYDETEKLGYVLQFAAYDMVSYQNPTNYDLIPVIQFVLKQTSSVAG